MDTLPSQILENTVNELSKLPGIGKRTALRFALHLLKQPKSDVENLASALTRLVTEIKYCQKCHCISDSDLCPTCSNPNRNQSIICVVENIQDVMAIENTRQFGGLYHVLGGVISPIDGIGINDLSIADLLERVEKEDIKEVILALPTTMEGDTTNFYLHKQLQKYDVSVSTIARGIAIGDNLEYADEITLGRSILNRMPFENVFKSNR
jgi:recombination protein RecR